MHRALLAGMPISPDNTPHGYNLTFAFPMLMFIIIATALFLRFRSSHRIPGHVALASSRWASAQAGTAPRPTAPQQITTNGSTLQEGEGQEGEGPEGTETPRLAGPNGPPEESTEASE